MTDLFSRRPPRHQLPENFSEAAILCGHDPQRLAPTPDRGVWRWVDAEGFVRHFVYRDTSDPGSRAFRPGGKYRTWREHRSAWMTRRRRSRRQDQAGGSL